MTDTPRRLRRSLLIAPGHREERLAKAVTLGADSIAFDLEDGVPPALKDAARRTVAAAVVSLPFGAAERVVRVNAAGTDDLAKDLAALPLGSVDALLVPKVESANDVAEVERLLDQHRASGTVLILTLETPRGILNALSIVDASKRTAAVFFGPGDFSAATGGAVTPTALYYPRSVVVTAAAAIGAQAIDAPYFADVKDGEATREDALLARELGFHGKMVFHPNQVAPVNEVFTPSPAEVAKAEAIVRGYTEGLEKGLGTVVVDGVFVAIDIVLMAERTLWVAREAAARRGDARAA